MNQIENEEEDENELPLTGTLLSQKHYGGQATRPVMIADRANYHFSSSGKMLLHFVLARGSAIIGATVSRQI